VYPELGIEAYRSVTGNPMTDTRAKELLGWEEVEDKEKATLTDRRGKLVRLARNGRNRPYYQNLADGYSQEQLRRRWKLNGETMIFDQHGNVVSSVHRLTALVLAEQDRTGPNKEYWKKFWSGPVTIDCIVVTGVDPGDDVADTVDRGKSRSDADVIYRGPWFADKPTADRRNLSKILGSTIKVLWYRTGLDRQIIAGKKLNRSAPEVTDFIARHPGIVRAVKHVHSENGNGRISSYAPLGTAAALLYLMGVSASDPKKYRSDQGTPKEDDLDLSMVEKAEEFWVCFGDRNVDDLKALHYAESPFGYTDDSGARATRTIHTMSEESTGQWRIATICKAWNEFALGNKVTAANLVIPFRENEHGMPEMIGGAWATVGGIDVGDPIDDEDDDDDGEPAGVEERKAETRAAKSPKKEPEKTPKSGKELLDDLRGKYPGSALFFKAGASGWKVFGQDVDAVHKAGGTIRTRGKGDDKTPYGTMYITDVDHNVASLQRKGHSVVKVLAPGDVHVVPALTEGSTPDPVDPVPDKKKTGKKKGGE
jgi:hypothetical protein